MGLIFRLALTACLASIFSIYNLAQPGGNSLDLWAYDSLSIPRKTGSGTPADPIVVAVVDDAFRLTHKDLGGFIFTDPLEIPGNSMDDEGNNYIDDHSGWDISDDDSDVSPPSGLEQVYYHGTYISSIITRISRQYFGETAAERIRILPVKVLSDRATRTYLADGYKGIGYAVEKGADIICIAWSGGNPGSEDLEVLRNAVQGGILMVGSAGNFNEEKVLYPAMVPEVLAVAGVNKEFGKESHSNFGMEVDLSAPGEFVAGAHPDKDNAYIHDRGTSAAAALVAGCAAVLLSEYPDLTPKQIKEALLGSSIPFDRDFSTYGGKLGAGIVNLGSALDYLSGPQEKDSHFSPLRSRGTILYRAGNSHPDREIRPGGGYSGFYLEPDISHIRKPGKGSVSIHIRDTVWNKYTLSEMPAELFVPSPAFRISLKDNSLRKKDIFRILYRGKTIDSTRLFCSDTRYLQMENGTIEDGSGDRTYANSCSCKWIITVPEGKKIRFFFDRLDTQANVDFIYLVDGQTAIPENFIAKFSGQNLPPVVVSRTNQVLVWFVTDGSVTGQGWKLRYESL